MHFSNWTVEYALYLLPLQHKGTREPIGYMDRKLAYVFDPDDRQQSLKWVDLNEFIWPHDLYTIQRTESQSDFPLAPDFVATILNNIRLKIGEAANDCFMPIIILDNLFINQYQSSGNVQRSYKRRRERYPPSVSK
jgi:hypothetical protein